jgi:hypothetical protein
MGTAHEMIWDFETISATKTRGVRQSVTTKRTDWLITDVPTFVTFLNL